MSLVLAVRYHDHFVLMADSLSVAGYDYYDGAPKLWSQYGYLLGHSGYTSDSYRYWRNLGGDLDDPAVHAARFKEIQSQLSDGTRFESSFLFAKGPDCFCLNQGGALWPIGGRWESIGIGNDLINYLMKKHLGSDPAVEEILALGQRVLEAVCTISIGVRPPLIWAESDEQTVREYRPGE